MSNQVVTIPQAFGGAVPAQAFQGVGGADELSSGVIGGFGIVTYKGKVWRTKYRGEEQVLLAADGRNARPELEVVIVKAAPVISKVFYKDGYSEGSVAPPDCWSVNGIAPDPAAANKQSPLCAGCKQNAWGSRISESGKAGKACSDNKRLAIVPADDIRNESLGGPMMMRVPPASLQDMANFGKQMELKGFPYYSFVTRLRFDPNEAFPKFIFEAIRPLTEDEAKIVLEMRNDPTTQRILEAAVTEVQHDTEAQAATQPPPATDLFTPAAAAKAAQMVAQETSRPQPVAQQTTAVPQNTVPPQTTEARNPVRPRFDPMTGQPIIYPDEQQATAEPVQDPKAFPDMPASLVRQPVQQTQPVVEQTSPVIDSPKDGKMESFDAALDNLLGTPTKK